MIETLPHEEQAHIDAYWRASNYLSVGQIYLMDNPLLREPLSLDHVKPRLLGHWGTTPGLNFIYAHLNRVIRKFDVDMIYITGPGHGGPGLVANTYLEGTYSEFYPEITRDEAGLKKLFKQFSFPGGIPSHVAPETPGSINEGGELGYSLVHAYGAVFDNPNLIAACIIGDGEAETGALAASWHSNKFLNPEYDGAVLPILHLNGYKIASATVLSRITREELISLLYGYGYKPLFVEGDDPSLMHQQMASTLNAAITEIQEIQKNIRENGFKERPVWPMVVFISPKGWTGPKEVDGHATEGSFWSHQVPLAELGTNPEHLKLLEAWLRSYRPEELFDEQGSVQDFITQQVPRKEKRMGSNPYANGGLLLKELEFPEFKKYSFPVTEPGTQEAEATKILGNFLRDIIKLNPHNFRLFGPDETSSNRLNAVFDVTTRMFTEPLTANDVAISDHGRVLEILSEHLCQGWLEGYLLTGRHGFFSSYEAFVHIVDSMFNQHAKWLKASRQIPWRKPIASLNYLLTSHVWRQDHNGFSHQDPGFIDHVVNKKAEIVRVYLPPDANCLLSVADHCLHSKNYVNVIVAGKQMTLQYLDMESAIRHCTKGIGIWEWASNDMCYEPDVVMACAGEVPTLETLAAVNILNELLPDLRIRVINVVDLMTLQSANEHPHSLTDAEFDLLFTRNKPIIFAFHGYPWLIHRLTYRRYNHGNMHVRGYKEEGTTSTPFDMVVLNDLDRFHLVIDVMDRVEKFKDAGPKIRQMMMDKLQQHKDYIRQYGEDMPEIKNWKWETKMHLVE